jgi:hypothetical protein
LVSGKIALPVAAAIPGGAVLWGLAVERVGSMSLPIFYGGGAPPGLALRAPPGDAASGPAIDRAERIPAIGRY